MNNLGKLAHPKAHQPGLKCSEHQLHARACVRGPCNLVALMRPGRRMESGREMDTGIVAIPVSATRGVQPNPDDSVET